MTVAEKIVVGSRRPKLAGLVIDTLRQRIGAGEFVPGARLPTENQLATQFGVSRTVVREAIAALAADGLVEPRQGSGVFLLDQVGNAFGRMGGESLNKISVALNVLEVRMGVEIEAAGLAAQRRSASQEAAIVEAWAEFGRLLEAGLPTGKSDFAFHHAIAAATNNPLYVEILDALGSRTIPCDTESPWRTESVLTYSYQAGLHDEHRRIADAIAAGDVEGARNAMRTHLSRSQERYRARLAEQNQRR